MICWEYKGSSGRDHWVMERRGKLSPADIKKHEIDIGKKWGYAGPVTITNIYEIN